MALGDSWRTVSGDDLSGPGAEQLPKEPAIYMWRRIAALPAGALDRRSTFVDWLTKELQTPYCVLRSSTLTPYLHVEQLNVGGYRVPPTRLSHLELLCSERAFRIKLLEVVQASLEQGPALYVGKADDLRTRIGQHLRGESDLRSRLDDIGLSWDRLSLRYLLIPGDVPSPEVSQSELLETIETVVTVLSMGSLVMRVG